MLIEKTQKLGGRIRSQNINGFIIDEGFQVSLTSYNWVRTLLSNHESNFYTFDSGARIIANATKDSYLFNPLRHPGRLFKTLSSPAISAGQIVPLFKVILTSPNSVDNLSTLEFLHALNVSSQLREQFFRPFFGGIFLDPSLQTSASLFVYLYKLFATGLAFVPRNGIGQLIDWITFDLPNSQVLLNTEVIQIEKGKVTLKNGITLTANKIIKAYNSNEDQKFNSTFCYWISIPKERNHFKFITLNGNELEPILHSSIISHVNPYYAPKDKDLVTITATREVSEFELKSWFSKAYPSINFKSIELIAQQHIKKALPQFLPNQKWDEPGYIQHENFFEVGDHTSYPSQQGVAHAIQNLLKTILS